MCLHLCVCVYVCLCVSKRMRRAHTCISVAHSRMRQGNSHSPLRGIPSTHIMLQSPGRTGKEASECLCLSLLTYPTPGPRTRRPRLSLPALVSAPGAVRLQLEMGALLVPDEVVLAPPLACMRRFMICDATD